MSSQPERVDPDEGAQGLAWLDRFFLCVSFAVAAALYVLVSGFWPWVSPDTPSYFEAARAAAPWAQMRHPLFGWLWLPIEQAGLSIVGVVGGILAFFVALGFLHLALRRIGLSFAGRVATTSSLLFSNSAILWHNAVHPEFAATVLVIAALAALLMQAASLRLRVGLLCGYALLIGATIVLRPIFLPAIVLFPMMLPFIGRLTGRGYRVRATLVALAVGLIPVVGQAGFRAATVGDFNIVSFGGFQMAGMAGLMLRSETVPRLPEDVQPLARRILDARTSAEQAGRVAPTPLNSTGQRSFTSTAIGYFDIYARSYDILLWGEILPLKGDLDWISFNRILMRFSLAVLTQSPVEYAAWIAGATSRTVGRAIVTNLPLMAGLSVLLPLLALSILRRGRLPQLSAVEGDYARLVVLVVFYTVSGSLLGVLTSFPASRYIDTAALLLPVLVVYPAAVAAREFFGSAGAGVCPDIPREP